MGYIEETQNNAVGREIICPHCEMKNDRDRDTCWSCGEALTIKKKIYTTVDLPLRYYVAAAFAYLAVFFGTLILVLFVPITCPLMIFCPPILAVCLAVCLSLIGGGLLLIALLGIWSALEQMTAYLRQVADGVSKSRAAGE